MKNWSKNTFLGFWANSGFWFWDVILGFRVNSGFGFLGFRVWGPGFRFCGMILGFGVQGLAFLTRF